MLTMYPFSFFYLQSSNLKSGAAAAQASRVAGAVESGSKCATVPFRIYADILLT
jgi:hypothetical protein